MSDTGFALSKILQVIIEPDAACVILLAISTTILWWRPRVGRWLVSGVAALILISSILPVGAWLLLPLENRFPRLHINTMQPPVGIVVLGGGVQTAIANERGTMALNQYGERITTMVILAHRFPSARVVYTGGRASIRGKLPAETSVLAPYLPLLGIAPERVVLETQSRNTFENAIYTKRAVQPRPGDRWLLVTSAAHMPRSMGVFRAAGWDLIPFPVDYQTTGKEYLPGFSPVPIWQQLRLAVHEYIGLVTYYVSGYTSTLFPGPLEKSS
jgi:uncharacterized SAM-binding protein YcdF (DUF218 family)